MEDRGSGRARSQSSPGRHWPELFVELPTSPSTIFPVPTDLTSSYEPAHDATTGKSDSNTGPLSEEDFDQKFHQLWDRKDRQQQWQKRRDGGRCQACDVIESEGNGAHLVHVRIEVVHVGQRLDVCRTE